MFDNAIFASLIPQFLMVLGFFSVIIAPSLTSSDKSNTNKELTVELFSVSSVNQNKDNSLHFENYNHQTQVVISTQNAQICKIPIITEISYPFFDIQLLKNEVSFSHFSRPPPYFVS